MRLLLDVGKAALSFIAGALFVAILKDPIEYRFIPWVYSLFYNGYIMEVYDENDLVVSTSGSGKSPDIQIYSLYTPQIGVDIKGRMIHRDRSGNDESAPEKVFNATGFRRSAVMLMSFHSLMEELPSAGVFIGIKDPDHSSVYIGKAIAQAHTPGSQDCNVTEQWAIVGLQRNSASFPGYIRDFFARPGNRLIAQGFHWPEKLTPTPASDNGAAPAAQKAQRTGAAPTEADLARMKQTASSKLEVGCRVGGSSSTVH